MIDVPRDDVVVMLEAGYIYLAMKRFKEARQVFEGICEIAPNHDVPTVALANVFFAQEKYMEAIRTLKGAIKDNPNSAFAHAHLGEAQMFYGKRDEARESLNKASKLEPSKDGKAGEFARSILHLMDIGYDPIKFKKDLQKHVKEAADNLKSSTADAPKNVKA